jgi:hypothetical protein
MPVTALGPAGVKPVILGTAPTRQQMKQLEFGPPRGPKRNENQSEVHPAHLRRAQDASSSRIRLYQDSVGFWNFMEEEKWKPEPMLGKKKDN